MSTYRRGGRGPEVTRLEIALEELGLYRAGLDDVFGPGMEAAVRAYQAQNGLTPTGEADARTFAMILAEPSPIGVAMTGKSTEYRSLSLTAGFETSTTAPAAFSGLAGDFDGQGISFGVLQWNLGQGTLQDLLKSLDEAHPDVVASSFGDGYSLLKEILQRPRATQLAWARTLQTNTRRSIVEPWRSRFRALGQTPEGQDAQVRAAEVLFERARRMSAVYGLWSERALALTFDIVVQNGSIRSATHRQIMDEFEAIDPGASAEEVEVARMRIIANRRAEASRAEFVEDVRRRKLAIVNAVGIVHGRGYDLERQYLIGLVRTPASAPSPTPSPDQS